MKLSEELKRSFFVALWFVLLTFPIAVIRVNTIEKIIVWRWINIVYIGSGSFVLAFLWHHFSNQQKSAVSANPVTKPNVQQFFQEAKIYRPAIFAVAIFAVIFPFVFSHYQINIMTTALIYVMLGLGLNIVVGQAGLLNLGYVAFYAIGAYSYALLNHHLGIGFWVALPIGALIAALSGILLGLPVLRLRGDYLAIVTLGFGEIIRLILENWNSFSFGPSGISNIPRPGFFGINLSLEQSAIYMYFLLVGLCLVSIFVVLRLQNSRIGRALVALREDELACQAMGIDKTKIKLTAFALGATWAGMAGVLFAAKTTFINPASFTFLESVMILSIVVLGGMGSITGVIVAALVIILSQEYLRIFSDYRMLIFGAALVAMMIFRPQGIIAARRSHYEFRKTDEKQTGR
jgi:branched-chain amino acid transport system permease protein